MVLVTKFLGGPWACENCVNIGANLETFPNSSGFSDDFPMILVSPGNSSNVALENP
jgi:hypothetical protein